MGYIINLGSKKRTHRTLIALPAHYHRTQTRVIHKRTWRAWIRDKMALRAVPKALCAVSGARRRVPRPEAVPRAGEQRSADNRTEMLSPANEQ